MATKARTIRTMKVRIAWDELEALRVVLAHAEHTMPALDEKLDEACAAASAHPAINLGVTPETVSVLYDLLLPYCTTDHPPSVHLVLHFAWREVQDQITIGGRQPEAFLEHNPEIGGAFYTADRLATMMARIAAEVLTDSSQTDPWQGL